MQIAGRGCGRDRMQVSRGFSNQLSWPWLARHPRTGTHIHMCLKACELAMAHSQQRVSVGPLTSVVDPSARNKRRRQGKTGVLWRCGQHACGRGHIARSLWQCKEA